MPSTGAGGGLFGVAIGDADFYVDISGGILAGGGLFAGYKIERLNIPGTSISIPYNIRGTAAGISVGATTPKIEVGIFIPIWKEYNKIITR